jgi:hypothetical protein
MRSACWDRRGAEPLASGVNTLEGVVAPCAQHVERALAL